MTLLGKRATLKGHLTRIENYVESVRKDESSFSAADIESNLAKIDDLKSQLNVVHEELLNSGLDEAIENEEHSRLLDRIAQLRQFLVDAIDRKADTNSEHEDNNPYSNPGFSGISNKSSNIQSSHSSLEQAIALLLQHQAQAEVRTQNMFDRLTQAVSVNTQPQNRDFNANRPPKLPTLSVPDFSGDYTEWNHFKSMFISIVHNNSQLSDVQKMQYLMNYTKGNAAKLIESLSLSDANYMVAWDTLTSQYEDQYSVVHQLIHKFFQMPTVSNPTPAAFTELVTTSKSILNALDAIQITSRDPWIIYILLSKLDSETKVLWSREVNDSLPTLPEFIQFLKSRMKSIEKCPPPITKPNPQFTKSANAGPTSNRFQKASVLANIQQCQCPLCNETEHRLFRCPKFLDSSPSDRLEFVRANNICRKCLTETHLTKDCTFYTCRKCQGHHSTLLHDAFKPSTNPQNQPKCPVSDTSPKNRANLTTTAQQKDVSLVQPNDKMSEKSEFPTIPSAIVGSSTSSRSTVRVFLETAVVRVLDRYGVPHLCRALLDAGAQVSLISQSLFQKLKLPKSLSEVYIGTVVEGGTKAKYQTLCQVQAMDDSLDSQFMLTCQIVPSVLQQKLPNWNVQADQIPIPSDISLADPTWYVPQPIDLIISNEFYNDIYTSKILRLGQGFPVLKESCFGWVISGPHTSSSSTDQIAYVGTTLASIDSSLKKFWEVEEVSPDHLNTPDHETVENIFQETTTRDGTGRYIVHIPFRPSVTRLHNNLPNATKQFLLLEKRLSNKPEIKTQYHAAMQENFDLNFFEKVPPEEINSTSYYMPHHAVIKESPVGTKLRIVKNASSKSQTGLSLNDVAMMGPIVQPDIATILLRFREHPYAFCCDIQKMYPQVLLHPPHRDYHRILWRSNPSEPISHYRARGVCFGVTTSPYLATRVLIDLAEKEQDQFPLAAKALKQNFYVDDCLISFPSIPEAKECRLQLTELLASAGMTLAKWCVNDPQITDHSDQRESCDIFPEKSKALGMIWLPQDDQFTFKLTKDFSKANTKREVLAAIASLYDPLGLISPVIVVGKLILQEIWKAQIPWDQPMSSEIITKWKQFAEGLSSIHSLHVPRSVSEFKSSKSRELHVFCDSSSFAYGAVAYVVTENETGERKAQLLMAKSRIAPTKSITIPKLELCATVLGARLIKKIQESLSFNEYFPWTDSTIVLGQIRSKRVKFDVFTAHRISEIHKLTDSSKWQHVPGGSNPADIVSRGLLPTGLKSSQLWWTGPKFLLGKTEDWPEDPYGVMFIASNIANESQVLPPHPLETILNKSNSYVKVKNILAYVLRFLTKSTRRVKGPLTPTEIHASEHKLISFAQSQHLSEVRSAIADGSMWTGRKFNNVRHLTPFIDEQGIIRVGGRLAKSLQDYDVRHPMLLPKCRLSTLITMQAHKDNMHAGPQLLLATLRQRYWPLGGRNLTRRVTRSCVVCWKKRPLMLEQRMGDLPQGRIEHVAPFKVCGVDLCGPVLTRPSFKRGGVSYKTYICVFVCFTTKAVHLEVVGSLTTESFIAALRRFVARRSAPSDIFSDNATNFKGAYVELKKFLRDVQASPDIEEEATLKGITWHFAPPRSPHHGGLYEAAVKALKHHLVREVGQTILTFEELNTVTAQIEAILNSRPITNLSEDPNEASALTPGHFLVGRPLNSLPDQSLTDVSPNSLSRWQLCQKILQHFAQRWKTEYLHLLQKKSKWTKEAENLQEGDIVLLCDEPMSSSWPMGIVKELHPGKDGKCRVVTVKTARGTYKRAIQRLSKLPVEVLSTSGSAPQHVNAKFASSILSDPEDHTHTQLSH